MKDLVKLHLKAGKGGDGKVSFLHEKYKPKGGPAGGMGGDGGSIIIKADPQMGVLDEYAGKVGFTAQDGEKGGKRSKTGKKGEDVVVKVPVGTIVWVAEENNISNKRFLSVGSEKILKKDSIEKEKYAVLKEGDNPPEREPDKKKPVIEFKKQEDQVYGVISNPIKYEPIQIVDRNNTTKQYVYKFCEITKPDQEVVVCQGGFGGRGNESFKSSTNTTPMEAEYGTFGEEKTVLLELKLLADVGLVGFPSAGKSSFLSKITKARPKIGNYPFTTINPNLGVLKTLDTSLVIADIPGLIEGASKGKGLGIKFLKHIEHCKLLVYFLYIPNDILFSKQDNRRKAFFVYKQYLSLEKELKEFNKDLAKKPNIFALNKIDIYPRDLIQAVKDIFLMNGKHIFPISVYTNEGIEDFKKHIVFKIKNLKD